MSLFHNNILSGSSGGADPVYVDDVFSTFLYEGTGADQSIVNGIDLSGEGGAVWIKSRDQARDWNAFDTERGVTKRLMQNSSVAEQTEALGSLSAFNSNGFTVGDRNDVGVNNEGYCSWTFRKAPGCFDCVTWTGSGANRTIAHNLGSVPGTIIVKRTDTSADWQVYHRSLANTEYLVLNSTAAKATGTTRWNSTTPTSSVFSLGTDTTVNASGGTYVAYIFAHDDQSFGDNSDEAIIKCGSYSATNSNGNFVNLGFEPQWVLTKNTNRSANWSIWDNMRGVMNSSASNDVALHPNTADADNAVGDVIEFNSTGFTLNSGSALTNWNSGETFIYIAIRRPHKPPADGDDVMHVDAGTNNSVNGVITTGFPVDSSFFGYKNGGNFYLQTRLTGFPTTASDTTGHEHMLTTSTAAASSGLSLFHSWDSNTTVKRGDYGYGQFGTIPIGALFKRAPGVHDVVAYTGTGSNTTISHNLAAVPEMMIVKRRDSTGSWYVYHKDISNTKAIIFDDANGGGEFSSTTAWNSTTPTSSVFSIGTNTNVNTSSGDYICLLFSTLSGISKVGSYTGTGSDVDVDCGFTAGARFVFVKRADDQLSSYWHAWNSAQGINAGGEGYTQFHSSGNDSHDYIDPLNAGFTITSSAPAALNASGDTYIFLAIA